MFIWQEDRRRTGRYVAGGTALAVILLALHHILLRGAPTIAGICIPAIIMAIYVLWVLYSARRDRRKVGEWKADVDSAICMKMIQSTCLSSHVFRDLLALSLSVHHAFISFFYPASSAMVSRLHREDNRVPKDFPREIRPEVYPVRAVLALSL